jgi:hypothetical protein
MIFLISQVASIIAGTALFAQVVPCHSLINPRKHMPVCKRRTAPYHPGAAPVKLVGSGSDQFLHDLLIS